MNWEINAPTEMETEYGLFGSAWGNINGVKPFWLNDGWKLECRHLYMYMPCMYNRVSYGASPLELVEHVESRKTVAPSAVGWVRYGGRKTKRIGRMYIYVCLSRSGLKKRITCHPVGHVRFEESALIICGVMGQVGCLVTLEMIKSS